MSIDLSGCDVARLEDAALIERFSVELCDDVLEMVRYGEPLIEWFGLSEPKTAGYSLVQLIETSSVVGHFSGHRRSAHLDVFSCKPYDADAVERFCVEFFGADGASTTFIERA